jgi:hypothetical protein
MKTISYFSFKSHDGVHQYIYNPNSKVSSVLVFKRGKQVSREDGYCCNEESHIRRIQYDLNHNCVVLRRIHQKQWVKSKIVDSLIFFIKYLFLFLIGGLYGMLSCIVFILELFVKYPNGKVNEETKY